MFHIKTAEMSVSHKYVLYYFGNATREQAPLLLTLVGGDAGEVHLETIIKDLRERFARVEVRVSPPLVAFRESVYITEEALEPQHKPAKVLILPCILPDEAWKWCTLVS